MGLQMVTCLLKKNNYRVGYLLIKKSVGFFMESIFLKTTFAELIHVFRVQRMWLPTQGVADLRLVNKIKVG